MRKSSPIHVLEVSGDRFESLDMARNAARILLAVDLAEAIRRMIERGALEVKDNRIIPKG